MLQGTSVFTDAAGAQLQGPVSTQGEQQFHVLDLVGFLYLKLSEAAEELAWRSSAVAPTEVPSTSQQLQLKGT